MLAINGGQPIRTDPFPAQITVSKEEKVAVMNVMDSGLLSGYRGNASPAFYGGKQVRALEDEFEQKFKVNNALAVNSCTSALHVACAAIGLQPGDEVIVTPWSMSCSASAPLIFGAIPVFADIEEKYYCLDPEDVKRKITNKTRAIIAVDLFGQPFSQELIKIAKDNNLYLIEDAAQAIGSKMLLSNSDTEFEADMEERYAGTLGDIGCFSFTQGKHLTAGEGGMIVTNDTELALKCAGRRNHVEAVIHDYGLDSLNIQNAVGFNMRMTEIQATIIREQLKKLDGFIENRNKLVYILSERLIDKIDDIELSFTRLDCTHSYYVHALKWNGTIHRDKFIEAVKAELGGAQEEGRLDKCSLGCGYITPIYRFPLFQARQHWAIKDRDYSDVNLPIVEKLWKDQLIVSMFHNLPLCEKDINDIVNAFVKVYENQEEIK